ncbi:MAG: trigger factor [Patescibacteria group bacterium]|nr:trigger factor [Patescibacteria group bacterium]
MPHKVLEKKSAEIKFEITVEAEKLKSITKIVTEDLSKRLKIDGFRPGKAPQFVIEKEVGKDQFWAEVIDKIIPEAYFEAILAEKVSAISQPQVQVKEFIPGEKLVFEAVTATMPEIKGLKYKDQKIKFKSDSATEKEKKEALEGLLEKYAEEKEISRAVKNGDRVEIDFEGTLKGLPFDGGASKNHPIVLGSNVMIPGFEEKIVGHKAGEEFNFEIVFPKEYHAKNLAGQKVEFKIKINKSFEKIKPTLDDNFAKNFGLDSLESLKKELAKELDLQKDLAARRKTEEKIIETIIKENKIEAPKVLVDEEIHRMVHEAEHNLSHSGLTMDKFLEMSNKTIEELHKEMEPEAVKRVQIGIVLGEVARLEKIEVNEAEIDSEIEKIIATATPGTNVEDLKAAYDTPERRREIGNNIIIRNTVEKLWQFNVSK